MREFVSSEEFLDLVQRQARLIDVRSQGEFEQSHFPGSVNIPILEDVERAQVGTTYKTLGQDKAIELGHELVSGEKKQQRVEAWVHELKKSEGSLLTCFRGGLRSKIAQQWCREAGVDVPRIKGGTKILRSFLIEQLEARAKNNKMILITGPTGSGKSILLRDLQSFKPCLDLEKIANHRGSAFGGYFNGQPSQAVFENRVSYELIRLEHSIREHGYFLVEDESMLIGRCALPEYFFSALRSSPGIFIQENLEARTLNTFQDYILESDIGKGDGELADRVFNHYKECTQRISKKLGGLRTSEILREIDESKSAFHSRGELEINKIWISKLLDWYYDPLYLKSLERRDVKYVFKGTRKEATDFFKSDSRLI